MGAPEPTSSDERARNRAFGRPHFGRGRAKEKEEEMMIALLHDFLPRGAKRVLIAVAGIFGAAFSFAFVDMMPFLIWMLIFVAADFATVLLCRAVD